VDIIKGSDHELLKQSTRPEWSVCMTKIYGWRMFEYSKCVYVDSDAMVLKNCDELFDYPELSAVPDMSWTDIFNSGVFVFVPSEKTYNELLDLTNKGVSFDKADQGLLNVYYSNWFNEKHKHLSYVYNTGTLACYSYPAGYERYGHAVKIMHFLGGLKPWEFGYDPQTKQVLDPPGVRPTTRQDQLQIWWNDFLEKVQPKLSASCDGIAGILATHNFESKPLTGRIGLAYKNGTSHDVRMSFTNLIDDHQSPETKVGG